MVTNLESHPAGRQTWYFPQHLYTLKAERTELLHSKEIAWSTETEKEEISCDLVGHPQFVCLIYTFDLLGGGSFVEWPFVIDHYSLHPQPSGWVGEKRNQICSIEHSTSLSGIMFFSVWTWKIRSIVCFDWKQRTHPAVRSTCTHCGMSFHHIRYREKCYIHFTAKICNWGNSHTVRNHDSEFGRTLMFKFTNIL